MNRALHFGFLLMGFSFTVTQGLLIRELLVAFYGNELSIGLILGSWLVLEAIGSGLLGRLSSRWGKKPSSFAALQVLFALFLPLCLCAAYVSRSLIGAIPGEGVGLVPIFWASFLILAPLGLVDGAMFAFGSRIYAHLTGAEALSISRVYVLEAAGGLVGGLVFTFLLIPFLYSLQIVLILAGLNLLAAALIVAFSAGSPRFKKVALAGLFALLLGCAVFLFSPLARQAQRWAQAQQWPGYDLLYAENSVYGNVAVIQRESQYTFYADGIPLLTSPVPDLTSVEEIVHLPMLFVPQPRRALVLSGGVGGVLRELLKYPLERVDYAELDPLLIDAVRQFPTDLTSQELADPRLRVKHVDGRLLARQQQPGDDLNPQESYDLVIVNLPYPSTLQLNRFYTAEFYDLVRGLVSADGVLVVSSPGTLSYMSAEIRGLNAMLYHTLQRSFPSVRPIPGDTTLWLASLSGDLGDVTLEALLARWDERGLETSLLTPAHIRLRLEQRYLDWFWSSLLDPESSQVQEILGEPRPNLPRAGESPSTSTADRYVNRDLYPVGLYYGLSYWNALFSPGMGRVLGILGRMRLWMLILPLLCATLLFLVVVRRIGKGRGGLLPIVIAATGFTGMLADLVIVFAFQSLYGHVYHWIGLLITAFMAGLGLGGLLMTRRLRAKRGRRSTLLWLEIALVLFWVLVPMLLWAIFSRMANPAVSGAAQPLLFLVNALAGFLVGAQFPLANDLWLARRRSKQGVTGVLYASDLVGAFLGAVLVSVVLVPILGIMETCILAVVLKLCTLLLAAVLLPR